MLLKNLIDIIIIEIVGFIIANVNYSRIICTYTSYIFIKMYNNIYFNFDCIYDKGNSAANSYHVDSISKNEFELPSIYSF